MFAEPKTASGRLAIRAGFTLIEVLVGLTIVAIALMAALRAVGGLTEASLDLKERTIAQWSAENRLAQIRVQAEFPAIGQRRYDCPQGKVALICQEDVYATPNNSFRRVEMSVFQASDGQRRIARLVGFATNLP
ncbi:MAG: type II secretion system minor pseudopilin GspI [Quisquiliibacterium sp.]